MTDITSVTGAAVMEDMLSFFLGMTAVDVTSEKSLSGAV